MDQATLYYTSGITPHSMAFDYLVANPFQWELKRALHGPLLDFGFQSVGLGYRRKISVQFAPLLNDFDKITFLYNFIQGTDRQISVDVWNSTDTFDITIDDETTVFNFQDDTFFFDAFDMTFVERNLTYADDDGNPKTIIPVYNEWDADAIYKFYVRLVDTKTVRNGFKKFEYLGGLRDDKAWGVWHDFKIDFGTILRGINYGGYYRLDWLLNSVLCSNLKLDTRQVDPLHGDIFDVVLADNEIKGTLFNSIKNLPQFSLTFHEAPGHGNLSSGPFIVDKDKVDGNYVG